MLLDVVLFVVGLAIVVNTLLSAIRTVVIAHGKPVRLTQAVFRASRRIAHWYARVDRSPSRQHGELQITLALGLLMLPLPWLTSGIVGYTLMFKSLGASSWRDAYDLAGSSMFTLGFEPPVRPVG